MNRSHIGGIETKPGLPQYATIVSIAKAFGMTPRGSGDVAALDLGHAHAAIVERARGAGYRLA